MKKLTPKFTGNIDELGKLHIADIIKFKQYLMSIKGDVEVVVKRKANNKTRSLNENNYYWGVVLPLIAQYMGDTAESAHEAMRIIFLQDHSKKIKTVKSTAKLSVADFEDYMRKIRTFMSVEHSVYIPLPNEVHYD